MRLGALLVPSAQSGGEVYLPLVRLLLERVLRGDDVPGQLV